MKRRLMVIILSLTLIFTLIPMTAFAEEETVTITLKATSIDNGASASCTLNVPKGQTLYEYFQDHQADVKSIADKFKVDGYHLRYNFYDFYIDVCHKKMEAYKNIEELGDDIHNCVWDEENNKSRTLFVPLFKVVKTVNGIIEAPVCGNEVKVNDNGEQNNYPQLTLKSSGVAISDFYGPCVSWVTDIEDQWLFEGTIKGDNTYFWHVRFENKFGYYLEPDVKASFSNAKVLKTEKPDSDIRYASFEVLGSIKAVHDWDSGEVTKEPTLSAEGVKTYTCEGCKITKTESIPKLQKGSDGTEVGPGASEEIADQKITGMKTDTDPKGSKFNKLRLRSTKQTKTSITLKWKSNSKAVKYVIYGNRCGSSTKIRKSVKLYTVKKSTKTTMTKVIKKVKGAKLKKNTYYKFLVVALNKKNEVVSTSRMIHVATKGGKYTNYKSISVEKAVITKAKNLKKGKSLKLEAKQIKVTKSLKARKHVPIRYESSNKSIAKVTSKGVIKALKKGTCYVYIYAQNGVYKKIKVVVK